MKIILTIAAIATAAPALAENRQGLTLRQFVEARGCTFVAVKNSNAFWVQGPNGGGCAAVASFLPVGKRLVDPDGIPGNGDEYYVSDN
jgi:hypothetical protein